MHGIFCFYSPSCWKDFAGCCGTYPFFLGLFHWAFSLGMIVSCMGVSRAEYKFLCNLVLLFGDPGKNWCELGPRTVRTIAHFVLNGTWGTRLHVTGRPANVKSCPPLAVQGDWDTSDHYYATGGTLRSKRTTGGDSHPPPHPTPNSSTPRTGLRVSPKHNSIVEHTLAR